MKTYTIKNDYITLELSEIGGEPLSIKMGDNEYLWHRDAKYWRSSAPLLFPTVGRLRGGEWCDGADTYAMCNHGFARHQQMKAVANAVANLSQEEIAALEKNGSLALNLDGAEAVIETTDVEIFSEDIPGWLVANEGKLTVALEVTVTVELRREGVALELVNRIQNIRKSSGFEITDKINIVLSKNNQTDDAVNEYKEYICNQVLANSLTLADEVEGTELDFDDFKLYASVCKC